MAEEHGTVGRYNHGCRCDDCKDARSTYNRMWRAKKMGQGKVAVMPKRSSVVPPAEPGANEAALLEQLALMDGVADAQPALLEMCRTLARVLDNRTLVSLHAQTARQYRETLVDLRKSAVRRSGKLATVRALRRPDPTTGAS